MFGKLCEYEDFHQLGKARVQWNYILTDMQNSCCAIILIFYMSVLVLVTEKNVYNDGRCASVKSQGAHYGSIIGRIELAWPQTAELSRGWPNHQVQLSFKGSNAKVTLCKVRNFMCSSAAELATGVC